MCKRRRRRQLFQASGLRGAVPEVIAVDMGGEEPRDFTSDAVSEMCEIVPPFLNRKKKVADQNRCFTRGQHLPLVCPMVISCGNKTRYP
jgi:hypothetical protein